jgi:hypothetical protein
MLNAGMLMKLNAGAKLERRARYRIYTIEGGRIVGEELRGPFA